MLEISLDFITGMMLGLEFPDVSEIEDVKWALVVDIIILRFQFTYWKSAE